MKRRFSFNPPQMWRGNLLMTVLTLVALLLGTTQAEAQNVTISPNNGRMICAFTDGDPTHQAGYALGSFGTWIHDQLSLTMTGSNDTELTEEGLLKNHANHFTPGDLCIFSPAIPATEAKNYLSAAWGATNSIANGYITIALPKGYRFTSYRFLLSHDITGLTTDNNYAPKTSTCYMRETDSNFNIEINQVTIPAANSNNVQVVELTRTGDDMGNVLYFRTRGTERGYYELCFRYVELTFTADADAPLAVSPKTQVTSGVSLLEIPFNTGKMDFGEITKHTGDNQDRFSYIYNEVTDMSANMLLYEYESTRPVTAANSFDGTEGLEAYNKSTGSITTDGNFIKLDPGSSTEQVYILETPTYATMSSNGQKNPIQFRIVDANIEYTDGGGTKYDEFTLSGRRSNTTYYANANFTPTSRSNEAARWFMDENGYIGRVNGGNINYLAVDNNNYPTLTTNKTAAVACTFTSQGYLVRIDDPNAAPLAVSSTSRFRFQSGIGNQVTKTSTNTQVTIDALSGGAKTCTLKVYGADGEELVDSVDVKPTNNHGDISLTDLNNDAIKFSVKGTGYVKLNVTLQALNPYIDQMTVVLNDTVRGKNLRMTRTFTADDFSVGGGTFRFYLPEDCNNDDLYITFEDLYSKYGDETYNHTTQTGQNSSSRYNFVKSQHYLAFNNPESEEEEVLDNNIYYNKPEAASETKEKTRIDANNGAGQMVRTQVGIVGNQAFRFNNADQLQTANGYMTEYPFTLSRYANQTNPGNGQFVVAQFGHEETDTASLAVKTFYVFTTDETKYNIAPTTATQHRFYAFYKMIVEVALDDYAPIVNFVKVYDKTCTQNAQGGVDTDAYYGAVVTAPSNIDAPLASDQATYEAMKSKIAAGGDVPMDLKHILYLDMSGLNGVYNAHSSATDKVTDFDNLRSKLGANALVFLPINSTDRYNNFAFALKGEQAGKFKSANNIILTDKQPFFSPYEIQVDAANYASYSRSISGPSSNSLVTYATIMMPFTLDVATGLHTNKTPDGCQFNLRTLNAFNGAQTGSDAVAAEGSFKKISGKEAAANKPYMVEVVANNSDVYSFIATQYGSNIIATPTETNTETNEKEGVKIIKGETVSGYNNFGTYSGVSVTKGDNVYYFNQDKFVQSSTLASWYPQVYVQPFRSYFTTSATGAKMSYFNIVYDVDFAPVVTNVAEVAQPTNLSVTTGHGFMLLNAYEDVHVSVVSLNGFNVASFDMEAGDQNAIEIPAGIYLVNKTKVVVK